MFNIVNAQKLWLVAFVLLLSLLSLACNENGSSPNVADTVISGVAQAGRVSGGTVSAYKVVDGEKGDLLESVVTESDGSFTLNLAKYRGLLLIEVNGGTFVDEATGQTLTLTTPMRTVLPASMVKGDLSASITPFTTVAAQLALEAPGGLTEDNVVTAITNVNEWLGGEVDVSTMRPVDLFEITSVDGSTAAERDYALIVAGLSHLAQILDLDSNEIVQSIIDDASDGILDGMNGTTQVFSDSGTLTVLLADAITDFAHSQQNTFNVLPSDSVTDSITNSTGAVAPVAIVDTTAPVATILSPLPGDVVGLTTTISWSTVDQSPVEVRLEVSGDAGASYTTLATGLPKSGTYTWDTTSVSDGPLYRIRISPIDAAGNVGVPAESDEDFAVDNIAPVVTLTSPVGGERLTGTETITWTTVEANPATVSIYLSDDSGANYSTLVADAIPDTGSYDWDTSSFPDGTTYRVWVVHTDAAGHYNESLGVAENPTAPSHSLADFALDNTPTIFDFNGDGFDDMIVGAPFTDDPIAGDNSGTAYIFFGPLTSTTIDSSTANVIVTGELAFDTLGWSVSQAGDVNGDTFDDVIIGADGDGSGIAYVLFGSAAPPPAIDAASADVKISGDSNTVLFFSDSVCGGQDVNGDGIDDIIVGAKGSLVSQAGMAFIYFGRASWQSSMSTFDADVTITGDSVGDVFGTSACFCDVNGDGMHDVLIGATWAIYGGEKSGSAYLYYGRLNWPETLLGSDAEVRIDGDSADGYLGHSVDCAGDFNGDGFNDIIIGASKNSSAVSDGGSVYLIFGGSNMPAVLSSADADVHVQGTIDGGRIGFSVSQLGDVNLDGFDDICFGAIHADTAYILLGSSSLSGIVNASSASLVITGSGGVLGQDVESAYDINNDGFFDVAITDYNDDEGGTDAGAVFILFGAANIGGPQTAADSDIKIIGEAQGDSFGAFRE